MLKGTNTIFDHENTEDRICCQKGDDKYLVRYANLYTMMASMPQDRRFSINSFGEPAETECGTAACLAGHAGLHPWFRRRGFTLHPAITAYTGAMSLLAKDNNNPTEMCQDFFGFLSAYYSDYGYNGLEGHIFDPDFYTNSDPTAAEATAAVRLYMEYFWDKSEVEEAIANATATYNADYVHKHTKNWEVSKCAILD